MTNVAIAVLYFVLMAEFTPKKLSLDKLLFSCRCCNNECTNHRIYLFGDKSREEGLVSAIKMFTGIEISEDDDFPKFICRNCSGKISTLLKKVDQFKNVCVETEENQKVQLTSARYKRGRKENAATEVETSPVSVQAAKKRSTETNSTSRQSLQKRFQKIVPKPVQIAPKSSTAPNPLSISCLPETRNIPKPPRKLPELRRQQPNISEEIAILSKSGLSSIKVRQKYPTLLFCACPKIYYVVDNSAKI